MNKVETRRYKKELLSSTISYYIGGDVEKLNNINKRLLKDILKKDVDKSLYNLLCIKNEYFNWEVEDRKYNLNSNFERLVYLFNSNYGTAEYLLDNSYNNVIEGDYPINIKNSKEMKSYEDLASEVGL